MFKPTQISSVSAAHHPPRPYRQFHFHSLQCSFVAPTRELPENCGMYVSA